VEHGTPSEEKKAPQRQFLRCLPDIYLPILEKSTPDEKKFPNIRVSIN
jgi:hypothetical protein